MSIYSLLRQVGVDTVRIQMTILLRQGTGELLAMWVAETGHISGDG